MAKIIFTNVPGHGHVNPTLPVVSELIDHGHRIIYYNTEDFRPQIERAGAEFRPYPVYAPQPKELTEAVNHSLPHVTVLLMQRSEKLTPYMVDELTREKPDVVIHDSICLWGMQSARVLGLPAVSSITTLVLEGAENLLTKGEMFHIIGIALPLLPRLIRSRRRLIKQYGKKVLPSPLFPTTGDLNIVFTSREFQPPTKFLDDRFRFVGPSIQPSSRGGDFPFDQLTRKPVIYVSLGTIHSANTDFYQKCFEAFSNHPGQFILSVGRDTAIDSLSNIPSNFIIRNTVPQLEVLQHVDLFITHGGINSVQEGLYYGVPLVVVPQQLEQAANGKQVVANGAGIMLGRTPPYGHVTVNELRESVNQVLGDAAYAESARRLGDSFRQAGGYKTAVNEIEAFLEERSTITMSAV